MRLVAEQISKQDQRYCCSYRCHVSISILYILQTNSILSLLLLSPNIHTTSLLKRIFMCIDERFEISSARSEIRRSFFS
jgi:hypothetical protein